AQQEPGDELDVVTGRAHRDGELLTVQPHLQGLLPRQRVRPRILQPVLTEPPHPRPHRPAHRRTFPRPPRHTPPTVTAGPEDGGLPPPARVAVVTRPRPSGSGVPSSVPHPDLVPTGQVV